ncbi:MAG: hypothetical protein V4459_07465 [Pseudomonadota bacterium]
MRILMTAVLAATSIALPAAAQTNASDTAVAPKPEKKICRRQEVTGSIIGSKAVCHTKSEWTAIDEANGRQAGDSLDRQRATRPMRPEG